MPATEIVLQPSQNAMSDWSSSTLQDELSWSSQRIQSNWSDYIPDGSGDYTMTVWTPADPQSGIDIGNHSSLYDALDDAETSVQDEGLLDFYDAVMIVDSRTYNDGIGIANVGWAGTNYGVGIIADDGNDQTHPHEVGHLYNATHGDFESTELHHSIMGSYGRVDCNNSTSYTAAGDWFSGCAVNKARNYFDNSGNL